MKNIPAKKRLIIRLPKLATMAFVFWGLSSGSHLDAAPVWPNQELPPHIAPEAKKGLEVRVLSPRDASLYRTAFNAQEKADWALADKALAKIDNKGLVGHVLADRYLRKGITVQEAKDWFASYSEMPEANALYISTKHLDGFSSAAISPPQSASEWQGTNAFVSPTGFRSTNDNEHPVKGPLKSQINTALRRGNPSKANEILESALNQGAVSITAAGDLSSRIAATFFYSGDIDNARKAAHIGAESGAPLGLWIEGLATWKQRDFKASANSFAQLAGSSDPSSWNQSAAAYWAYRAHSRLGDKPEAYRWLAVAAQSPHSFYGAMASGLMGRQTERSWKMPELEEKSVAALLAEPAGWRALALAQVGRNDLAESELRHLLSTNSGDIQTAALALAEKTHMPSLVLQLSGATARNHGKPFDAALYPVPPWKPSRGFTVERALIYAIMRRESQFDPEAVSSRGACGLMQIMPKTARLVDETRGEDSGNCADRLLDPATNVDMGQKYVHVLAEKPFIGNNLLFMLVAYNGGPGNLVRRLNGYDPSDPLLFIESLPVRETRDYVEQVLLHYWMYKERLSQPETAVMQLAHGEWPEFALRDDAGGHEMAKVELVRMDGTR
jgi:soluble lytic murein transglycosylase-like protein